MPGAAGLVDVGFAVRVPGTSARAPATGGGLPDQWRAETNTVGELVRIGTQGAWLVTMRSTRTHSVRAAAVSVCCAACACLASWSARGLQYCEGLGMEQLRFGKKKSDAVG